MGDSGDFHLPSLWITQAGVYLVCISCSTRNESIKPSVQGTHNDSYRTSRTKSECYRRIPEQEESASDYRRLPEHQESACEALS